MDKRSETAIEFGKKLKKIMEEKGVSANSLAGRVGTDRASFTKYFKGETCPRIDIFLRICEELNIEPNYFLNIKNEPKPKEESKEKRFIKALFYTCANGMIITKTRDFEMEHYYTIDFDKSEITTKLFSECIRYCGSELTEDINIAERLACKYEPKLIEAETSGDLDEIV